MSGREYTSQIVVNSNGDVEAHVWRDHAWVHKHFHNTFGRGAGAIQEAQAWVKDVGWNGKRAADKYE